MFRFLDLLCVMIPANTMLSYRRMKNTAAIQARNPVDCTNSLHGIAVPVDLKVAEHEPRSKLTGFRGLADQVQTGASATCYPGLDK
jgi:hypothetical protein